MAEDGIFRKVHWPIGHQFEETPGDKDREAWFAKSMGFSRQEYWSGVPLPPLTGKPGMLQFIGSQRVRHD